MSLDDFAFGFLNQLLGFFDPTSRIYFLYLVSSLALAMIAFWQIERHYRQEDIEEGREPINRIGFFAYVFNPKIWLHPSSLQDMKYFVANAVLYYGLAIHYLIGTHGISFEFYDWASYAFGPAETAVLSGVPAIALYTLASVLALDFGVFVAHWLFHHIPFLWQFHKVHHSAVMLNPMTLFRMHPVDLFLTALTVMFFQSLAFAGFFYLTASEPQVMQIFGLNIILFFFYLFGYNLRHTHIWLNYPQWLNRLLVSPAQHQIHHSSDPKHFNKNMGLIFSVWDQLFGTHYNPGKREELTFGLSKQEPNPFHSVSDLYCKPFIWSWAILKGRLFSTSRRRSFVYVGAIMSVLALSFAIQFVREVERAQGPALPDLRLEELTWTQIDAAMSSGYRTVIVPIGGTEQNGPFVALGKHNRVVAHTSSRIAETFGDVLVAPVMAYVPEGDIDPEPTGHMQFAGTLTLPEPVFEQVLKETARSLKLHGFNEIYFVGDSGSTQKSQERVAQQLASQWAGEGVTIASIDAYYSGNGQFKYLLEQGYSKAEIGYHAGMRDMSEVMAVHPDGIHFEARNILEGRPTGQSGDYHEASRAIGRKMLSLKVEAAVRQIKQIRQKTYPKLASNLN